MTDRVHMPLLDIMVGQACELRCVACTNGMGMLDHLPIYKYDAVCADIDQAARLIETDVLVLLGGEPLLHKRIVDILRHAKAAGIAGRVRVLTNGIRLHKMTDDFWAELEDLKISIYPARTPAENVDLARERQKAHGFELSFYDVAADPFRAVLTPDVKSPMDAQATYARCWYRHNTRKVEQGYLWRCCTSPSISKHVLGLGPEEDGLLLETATAGSVADFLDRPWHANACTRCHGNMGPRLAEWTEIRDRTDWMEASTR